MPTEAIRFVNDQRTGDQALAGASPLAINVIVDGVGAVRRRPGAVRPRASNGTNVSAFGGEMTGLFSFEDLLVIVHDTSGWTSGSQQISTLSSETLLDLNSSSTTGLPERPTAAETQFRLVLAGGLAPVQVAATTGAISALGGSPSDASQVAALASRVVLNDLTSSTTAGRIRYSGVGNTGNETWSALGFASAEARPDAVVALRENSNELFVFGETTLQIFTPDAQFVLVPQRAINRGCSAAHSVVRVDEEFAWLDERRQFVVSDGRAMEVISDPMASVFDAMETVDDCWGFRWEADQFDVLVWTFPTDGRTFAYQKGAGWSQWTSWSPESGHSALGFKAHHYSASSNRHFVGIPRAAGGSYLAELSTSEYADQDDDIKAEVTTGFINHGTDAVKFTDALHLTFKRGQTSTEPQVLLSWRDNLGAFGAPRRISLGTTGDYVSMVTLRSLGGYRRRQWKLEFTGDAEFVLASVTEDYTVGAS